VYETDGKSETWYVNDGIQVLMELNEAKAPVVLYNPGISQTRLTQDPPLTEYMLLDGLGSIAQWTDDQGNLTHELFYEPFGRQQYSPRPDRFHRHRYVELAHDDQLELTYLNARWYDSAVGRFMSRDPSECDVRIPQAQNKYLYALARSTSLVDLDGRAAAYYRMNPFRIDGGLTAHGRAEAEKQEAEGEEETRRAAAMDEGAGKAGYFSRLETCDRNLTRDLQVCAGTGLVKAAAGAILAAAGVARAAVLFGSKVAAVIGGIATTFKVGQTVEARGSVDPCEAAAEGAHAACITEAAKYKGVDSR
jgi:RHS repeat-associated protein